ncbi:sodium channel and clathrin linker 1 isoform X2 [Castor canadensis]|uniref:Sodium channel and clathrin linker 1 isoform X2 n=1 Tax=Castor canadensis TaxID=51338 RepID=A0AC58JX58_CASCN
MATETDFLSDQNHRQSEVLRQSQMENFSKYSTTQRAVLREDGDDISVSSAVSHSFFTSLITEYEKHVDQLSGQVKYYQQRMGEMKLQLENVIKENERLHGELKDAIEKQLDTLPLGSELCGELCADQETIKNLREQLHIANEEKAWAVELWQTVSREFSALQRRHQEQTTKAYIHIAESQKQKTNQHFLDAVTEQNVEIEQLRKQLRKSKLDLRVAAAKVEELTRVTEVLHEEVQKKTEDVMSARGREEASDRRLHQLQCSIRELEARLCVTVQEVTQLREDKAHLEKQTRDLQAKCSASENEKYEAITRARESMQLLEEANLEKSQVLFEEKQKDEDREKMRKTIAQLLQDAITNSRNSVKAESTKIHYEAQISQLTEELSALQMECDEKQEQIERVIRGKKAVEEELEKVLRESRGTDSDYRKLEEMHHRCLAAERLKDDLQLSLKRAENRIKQLEVNSSEEIARSHEIIQKLQSVLESERENCGAVSEQRLRLQQENEQLQKETEDLRKVALEAQRQAKLKISTMEHEFSIKERGFEVQLREMEDSNRNSTMELRHLLATQQKAASRWKEERKKLTESTEIRISNLKSELSRQKLHTQELVSQLEMANEKVAENEKLIQEHQEKANRLQRRLSQAEERAASASQQLSVITVQRRKAASLVNLETI